MFEISSSDFKSNLNFVLECSPCRIHPQALEYTSFGKPHPSVFKNAELVLKQLTPSLDGLHHVNHENAQCFKTLYMIGDNPAVDIRGARQVWLLYREIYFTSLMHNLSADE